MTRAVVLLSGGVDSSVVLALALRSERSCVALTFSYGQMHQEEIEAARLVAAHYEVSHCVVPVDFSPLSHSSALLCESGGGGGFRKEIPSTYVPARNTIFLAYAFGMSEALGAEEIHFGPNAHDCAGYPDCRPEFVDAFQTLIACASAGDRSPTIVTPLISMSKQEIVATAKRLGVPLDLTWSCYSPASGKPCGRCAACLLRDEALRSVDF